MTALIRDLVEHVPPADFLAVRFGIAAVVMFVLFRRQTLALTRRELRVGVVLGLLYGVAQVLQTTGLAHTDASVSGFITGTYVVLTPVLGAVLLQHDRRVLEPAADEREALPARPGAAEAGEQGRLGRHPLRLGVDEGAVQVPEHGGGSGGHEGPR